MVTKVSAEFNNISYTLTVFERTYYSSFIQENERGLNRVILILVEFHLNYMQLSH